MRLHSRSASFLDPFTDMSLRLMTRYSQRGKLEHNGLISALGFESVQPESLEPLLHDHFKVIVFVGANQTKIPFNVVRSLQKLGSRAEYIKLSGHGSNALDFH